MIRVEEVGIYPLGVGEGLVVLKGKRGSIFSRKDAYKIVQCSHTQQIYHLITGEHQRDNYTTQTILELAGKSVKKQDVVRTKEVEHLRRNIEHISRLEFSDGDVVSPVQTGCAFPLTFISGGNVNVEDDLFDLDSSRKFRKKYEEYRIDDVIFKSVGDLKPESFERDEEKKPVSEGYSEYFLKAASTAVMGGIIVGEPPVTNYQRWSILATFENNDNECIFEFPINGTVTRNLSERFPEDIGLRNLKEDISKVDIMTYTSLMGNIMSEAGIELKGFYADALKRKTMFGKDPRKMTSIDMITPLSCFVEVQKGSEKRTLETSPQLAIVLWSKKLDYPISIKEIRDVEEGPENLEYIG